MVFVLQYAVIGDFGAHKPPPKAPPGKTAPARAKRPASEAPARAAARNQRA